MPSFSTSDIDPEQLRQTIEAAAWLYPIAQSSVELMGWNPVILLWLEKVGRVHAEELAWRNH